MTSKEQRVVMKVSQSQECSNKNGENDLIEREREREKKKAKKKIA
jgi:hypothetical protein